MKDTWLLLDGNYLAHRAFHTVGQVLINGKYHGTLFGVLKDISHLMSFFNTTRIVVAWDHGKPKRREIYPTYKRNRAGAQEPTENDEIIRKAFYVQVDMLKHRVLEHAGVQNVFWEEGYEADDIIAEACKLLPKANKIIVTADKDLFQCINTNTSVYNPTTRKMMSRTLFINEYGIQANWWARVKAIAGCNSDGVKGIPGVGEKTAIKYLLGKMQVGCKTHCNIISDIGEATITRNMSLVCLPFPGLPNLKLSIKEVDMKAWGEECGKYGIETLKQRYKRI